MRRLSILLILGGMVFALAGPASAATIPFRTGYTGPYVMHLINFDQGTEYTGLEADGVTPVTLGQAYTPDQLQKNKHASLGANEDAWGVFRIDTIFSGMHNAPDGITQGSKQLYGHGDAGLEIVGIFYGRQDNTVIFESVTGPTGTVIQQTLFSAGDTFEMFVQPLGASEAPWFVPVTNEDPWSTGLGGPGARVDANEYPGIGYDGTGTDTIAAGAEQVLVGTTQSGFLLDDVFATFVPQNGTGSGTFDLFISWTGGTQLAQFDQDPFPNSFSSVTGVTADMRLAGTTRPNFAPSGDPWLVESSDPAMGAFVPEPVTMAGLVFGLGSLAGYVRRRRSK